MARFLAAALLSGAVADKPAAGTYKTSHITVTDDGLEPLSGKKTRDYTITFPKGAGDDKFPLLVYAHGAAGGGIDILAYQKTFTDMAAYGFVVIAPQSCFLGCNPPKSYELDSAVGCLPWVDGPQWKSFVYENTRAVDYAKNQTSTQWASLIDWEAGIGVIGHSMGGEVVSQMASAAFAEKYNVKAAVCEHCLMCKVGGDVITTPAMFMTGTGDYEVEPAQVKGAYKEDKMAPKSYRNEKGRGHTEMLNLLVQYNSAVASHAAAFMKVHITGDKGTFYDQVYGTGADSFCNYANMKDCEHDMGTSGVSV